MSYGKTFFGLAYNQHIYSEDPQTMGARLGRLLSVNMRIMDHSQPSSHRNRAEQQDELYDYGYQQAYYLTAEKNTTVQYHLDYPLTLRYRNNIDIFFYPNGSILFVGVEYAGNWQFFLEGISRQVKGYFEYDSSMAHIKINKEAFSRVFHSLGLDTVLLFSDFHIGEYIEPILSGERRIQEFGDILMALSDSHISVFDLDVMLEKYTNREIDQNFRGTAFSDIMLVHSLAAYRPVR
ncbi:hypothetical protein [Sphingobacterium suaedae]|uniref:Uncharacterized protein n=1 Tax=Sphingobacterium suaedae TaxID=1686402 RepID=A0ABW5KMY1_9SPHI